MRHDRDVDELIGLCRGVLADGAVNSLEGQFLLGWLERRRDDAALIPPFADSLF